jgi:hypothetical protein
MNHLVDFMDRASLEETSKDIRALSEGTLKEKTGGKIHCGVPERRV